MGIARASSGPLFETGLDGQEYRMPILTMRQHGELASWWKAKRRTQHLVNMAALELSQGQKITALDDFERNEATYPEVLRFSASPEGIDKVIRLSLGLPDTADVECIAEPLRRAEIAAMLTQRQPVEQKDSGALPDPFGGQPGTTGGPTPPGSDDSTASTPGA